MRWSHAPNCQVPPKLGAECWSEVMCCYSGLTRTARHRQNIGTVTRLSAAWHNDARGASDQVRTASYQGPLKGRSLHYGEVADPTSA